MANNSQITQNDLFIRLIPAFNTKIKEWERENITGITPIILWNYCLSKIWKKKINLRMYELVDDILNIDIMNFLEYKKQIDRNDVI